VGRADHAEVAVVDCGDLGDHQGRDDQRAGVRAEQLQAGEMMAVVGVDRGVEGAGVDNDRYLGTSAARISSIRSEMSVRPLRPAPAASR
jgi:hypothetical protein